VICDVGTSPRHTLGLLFDLPGVALVVENPEAVQQDAL
jgi:hypothetical protein